MKQVNKSVLLSYSPREMYELVTAVPAYAQFLPWCVSAEVLSDDEHGVLARLGLKYAGVRHTFTTRNRNEPYRCVSMQLVDGPFSMLDGTWQFLPLGKPGVEIEQACRIEFELRYAFSSVALEAVLSPVFDRVANTFVDCFVKRAEQVYGSR